MEPNYLLILDYAGGNLSIIHLTAEEIKESEKYDDFSDFLQGCEFFDRECNGITTTEKGHKIQQLSLF